MNRRPQDRDLRAFESVARLGSMSAAADELALTLSAVSHRIRALESELKTQLFLRRHRGLELTIAGNSLFRGLTRAYEDIGHCVNASLQEGGRRRLTVFSSPSFAAKCLVPRLSEFAGLHPHIDIRLLVKPVTLALPPEIDVAIVYNLTSLPDYIFLPLPPERIYPVCTPGWRQQQRIRTAQDLLPQPRILSENIPISWNDWFSLNAVRNEPPEPRFRFDRSFFAIAAATQGMAVAFDSELFMREELRRRQLVPACPGARPVEAVLHAVAVSANSVAQEEALLFRDWLLTIVA